MANYDPYEPNTNIQGNNAEPEKQENKDQGKAAATALVGTAALGGAAYGLSKFMEEGEEGAVGQNPDDLNGGDKTEIVQNPEPAPSPGDVLNETGDASVGADSDSNSSSGSGSTDGNGLSGGDGMSFDEAFALARRMDGPGHFFKWRGNVYHTHYVEEWEKMDQNDRLALMDKLHSDPEFGSGSSASRMGHVFRPDTTDIAPNHLPAGTESTDVVDGDIQLEEPEKITDETKDLMPDSNLTTTDEIVEEQPIVEAVSEVEKEPDIVLLSIPGQNMAMVDTNGDGTIDMVMTQEDIVLWDTDGDGTLDSKGVYNGSSDEIQGEETISGAGEELYTDASPLDDTPTDFNSDHDLGSYV